MKNLILIVMTSILMAGCVVEAEPVYAPTYGYVWVEAHWEYVNGVRIWYPRRYVYRQNPRVYIHPRRR